MSDEEGKETGLGGPPRDIPSMATGSIAGKQELVQPVPAKVFNDVVIDTLLSGIRGLCNNPSFATNHEDEVTKIKGLAEALGEIAQRRKVVRGPSVPPVYKKFSDVPPRESSRVQSPSSPPARKIKKEEESEEEVFEGAVAPDDFSQMGSAMQGLAKEILLDPDDPGLRVTARSVQDFVFVTDPAVMDKTLVPLLNSAWAELFEAKTEIEVSTVISAICIYFAVNSTSSRIPAKEKIVVKMSGRRIAIPLMKILGVAFNVTGESDVRRVMRAYSDFTRECLVMNPNVRTKLFREFSVPQNHRSIAFDFADYCCNPPLTSVQEEVVRQARNQSLARADRGPERFRGSSYSQEMQEDQ